MIMSAKMNVLKKMVLATSMLVFIGGCGDSAEPETQNCGSGDEVIVDGEVFCIYAQGITEEGFSCPDHVNVPNSYGDMLICSSNGEHSDALFGALHDRSD